MIWQEGVRPTVVVELLSPGTRDEDLGRKQRLTQQPSKWEVYERILGIPYYIVYDRYTNELQAFQLVGDRYHSPPNPFSNIPCQTTLDFMGFT